MDDELFMRVTLRDMLEDSGYAVTDAESGTQALGLVAAGGIDAVLLDIVMPGMDGFETCVALRGMAEGKHLPVLMVTSLEDETTVNRAYAAGATDYLPKPVNQTLLHHHLRYVLRSSQLFEELRQQQERLVVAQRIARLGHWEWDAQKGQLLCSLEAKRVFGLTQSTPAASLNLETLLSRVHPEDRSAFRTALQQTLDTGNPSDLDHRLLYPCGTLYYANSHLETGDSAQGRGSILTATIQDITERKQAEEKLLLSGKVFDHSSEMILITDADLIIIDVNPACCSLTGFERAELVGSSIRSYPSTNQDEHFFRRLWESLTQFGRWQGELWNRRKDGESFPTLVAISNVTNEQGVITHYVAVATDISKLRETEQRLQYLTQFDPLTDLPNRVLFYDRVEQALVHSRRNSGVSGVLFLDLDNFKEINDTLGYQAGDLVLQMFARRLVSGVRKIDSVARLGTDEFSVILRELNCNESAALVAQRILDALNQPFEVNNSEFFLTCSIGLALFPADADNSEDLIRTAENAMQFAKAQGKNNYQFFSKEMNSQAQARLKLKTDLRRALERQEFLLHYQAKFDSQTTELTGLEALVRWQHPERGLVPPLEFIPLAEETGLIVALGEQVLRMACAQNREWRDRGFAPIRVAVNLSANQFRDPNLLSMVSRVLAENRLPADALELEITESALMQDTLEVAETLQQFRSMGIRIALDDFGTGYSSLSYLKRFPVDTLKIDYSFVKNIFVDAGDAAIVEAIIAMALSLKMQIIAEGVETDDQRNFVRDRGCQEVQGYVAGMPLPASGIECFFQQRQAAPHP